MASADSSAGDVSTSPDAGESDAGVAAESALQVIGQRPQFHGADGIYGEGMQTQAIEPRFEVDGVGGIHPSAGSLAGLTPHPERRQTLRRRPVTELDEHRRKRLRNGLCT